MTIPHSFYPRKYLGQIKCVACGKDTESLVDRCMDCLKKEAGLK